MALLIFMSGCGAKKSESLKKEEITKQDFSGLFRNSGNSLEFLDFNSNLKINSLTTFDEENEKTTIKKTFSPINSNALATYTDENGKKQELNNTTYSEEKTFEKNKKKSEKSKKSEKVRTEKSEKKQNSNSTTAIKKKAVAKKASLDKKNNQQQWKIPFWSWIVLILIILLILAYLNKKFGWLKYVTAFVSGLFQIRKK